jgi:stearoyl-CoA desaturase (delta-9 desaturase)
MSFLTKNQRQFLSVLPYWLIHLSCLGVFFVKFEWKWLILCVGFYYLRMFGITAGYHRYFSHRSYKMKRIPQFFMALLGLTALQKGPLWWAAHHRHHHRFSDMPEDLHSPLQKGFWWSHQGWILDGRYDEIRMDLIPDFAKFPELRFMSKYYYVPGFVLGGLIYALGGWAAFFWIFSLSTTLLYHGTYTINSLAHVFGSRRYTTTDTSRNNLWLSLLTLGEGWHNNHHCYQSSANQGFFWWEIDMSYYALKCLEAFGLVSDLRKPPLELLEPKRMDHGALDRMPQSSTVSPSQANVHSTG